MEKQFKHQGDIPMYPFIGKVSGEKVAHKGSFTIAFGEATGHHHTITVENPDDLEIDDLYTLSSDEWKQLVPGVHMN